MASVVDCLRPRYAVRLLISTIVGRLSEGMGPLVIAVFLRSRGFDFAVVGGLTALYGVSASVGIPLSSRAIDRVGQPKVLFFCATLTATGFLLLSAAQSDMLFLAVLAVTAAGGATPPLEPSLRSLWPDILGNGAVLRAAYALDAALQQMVFVLGPLCVVLLLLSGEPTVALVAAAGLTLVGTVIYATAPPTRQWRSKESAAGLWGAWRSVSLRSVVAGLSFVGIALGALNLIAVVYGERFTQAGFPGLMLGINATGALIGGLVYGSRTWPGDPSTHLRLTLIGIAAGYAPLAISPGPAMALICTAIGGLFLAPSLAAAFAIVGRDAPVGTTTESFGWLVTAMLIGNAIGSSVSGVLVEQTGRDAVGWLPSAAAVIALFVLVAHSTFFGTNVSVATSRAQNFADQ